MKVLVTGGSGFLGRAVVEQLVSSDHDVTLLVRPARSIAEDPDGRTSIVRGDLRERGQWMEEIGGHDVVVHLAAATSGDFNTQFASTVVATENLVAALERHPPSRLVHISSFSVYDYTRPATGAALDEEAHLEGEPLRRDAYTRCKLLQEGIVREFADRSKVELVVLRPGAIFGPGTEWDHGAAIRVGRFALVFAPRARMRLIEVNSCARAIVAAVAAPGAAGRTLNLVDDDPPTHFQFFRSCRRRGATSAIPVPVPWPVVDLIGRFLAVVDGRLLAGRAKLPEILAHRRQQARWRDFSYPNASARSALGWRTEQTLDDGITDMLCGRPSVSDRR